MLVLSRQRDETIMIGDDIEITIVDIRGDKVRLGITAPATIPVHRKEVYEAIQRENREAANIKREDLPNMPAGSARIPGKGIGPRMPVTRPHQPGEPRNGTTPPVGRVIPPQSPAPLAPQPPAPAANPPEQGGAGRTGNQNP